MATKKDMLIAVLATFCMTATLFLVTPTRSQPTQPYDSFMDINEDGKIGPADFAYFSTIYGSVGETVKNIRILSNALSLNLANNKSILAGESQYYDVTSTGYRTIAYAINATAGITCYIHWIVGGVDISTSSISSCQVVTSAVYGEAVVLNAVCAQGYDGVYSLGIYLTDK